jgi:hypothetical protein
LLKLNDALAQSSDKFGVGENVEGFKQFSQVGVAKEGYDVEQNPPPKANGKEPDYKIEGEYADCYAPNPNSGDSSVHRKIREKVSEGQADIIVVNADDAPNVSAEGIKAQIDEYPISGLRQVIVIKNGKVTNIIPSR